MKHQIVYTSNVARLQAAAEALLNRGYGMPGMGLVHGPTGYGKTTAVGWLVGRVTGVFVRGTAVWTPATMLECILRELGVEPRPRCARMLEQIVAVLAERQRPLFIDEADYLMDSSRLVDTLRDLHDLSSMPVVLIGMERVKQRLGRRPQLAGRIAEDVPFLPATEEDVHDLARDLAEVQLAPDVLADLASRASGEVRRILVGFHRLEQWARGKGTRKVALADLPRGFDYFTGAPTRARKAAVVSLAGKDERA